jgi:hypothetical protein
MWTLGDDIVLLAIRQDGKLAESAKLRFAVAGSELVRLAAARRIDVVKKRIVVIDPTPTGDPLLDAALGGIVRSRRPPYAKSWVSHASTSLPAAYLDRLAASGVVRKEHRNILMVTVTRWFAADIVRGTAARARVDEVAYSQGPVDSAQAALGGLVYAVGLAKDLYPGFKGHAARERLHRISRQDPSVSAVRAAVADASRAAVDSATDAATRASMDAAVRASTDAAVRASVDAAVHAAIAASVSASVDAAHAAAAHSGHDGGGGSGHH